MNMTCLIYLIILTISFFTGNYIVIRQNKKIENKSIYIDEEII